MPRWFNTAGPCDPAKHYMLPALRRLPQVRRLIEQEGYFVLHAPRQVGKTTALLSLARELTAEGRYAAALVSMEAGEPFSDVGVAEAAVLNRWRRALEAQLPPELCPPPSLDAAPGSRIGDALTTWARASPRPVVVFLDDIDALPDNALLSVLRQIRSSYPHRPTHFPHAMAFIGMRDVQHYRVVSNEQGRLDITTPFNIIVRSLSLRNFTWEEVTELCQQHTQDTGQRFEPEALALAFELTQGQPWLVNALAKVAVEELVPDTTRPVRREDIERAKNILIDRQETHLGSLAAHLREPRVRTIVEPLLAGLTLGGVPEDDVRFVQDLGLLRIAATGGLEVANPIYRQIIPCMLASTPMASLPRIATTWLDARGRLDTERLMDAFMAF